MMQRQSRYFPIVNRTHRSLFTNMSTAGPELPPHLLAKRKREKEAQAQSSTSPSRSRSSSTSSTKSSVKRRRVLGPSLPPAPLSEQPIPNSNPANSNCNSDSDSESDVGPSLPPPPGEQDGLLSAQHHQITPDEGAALEDSSKPQREEWMLIPPQASDWSSRVDPTKLRNRKFNTSKAPPSKGNSKESALWTETPEQKRQRLKNEVMGVSKPAQLGPDEKKKGNEAEVRETQRRIREYNERNRGESLYSEHKKVGPREKEDDPSQRAFDREKDIGGGIKIGHAQKKELLNRAAGFGDRFAGGNYL